MPVYMDHILPTQHRCFSSDAHTKIEGFRADLGSSIGAKEIMKGGEFRSRFRCADLRGGPSSIVDPDLRTASGAFHVVRCIVSPMLS